MVRNQSCSNNNKNNFWLVCQRYLAIVNYIVNERSCLYNTIVGLYMMYIGRSLTAIGVRLDNAIHHHAAQIPAYTLSSSLDHNRRSHRAHPLMIYVSSYSSLINLPCRRRRKTEHQLQLLCDNVEISLIVGTDVSTSSTPRDHITSGSSLSSHESRCVRVYVSESRYEY